MDDVILAKRSTIERCMQRIAEDYGDDFETNLTRQDAVLLNLERACQAAIDLGAWVVAKHRLGNPTSSREIFLLLHQADWIDDELTVSLVGMVGFRNIAVHDYARLNLDIVRHIIQHRLKDLDAFSRLVLERS